MAEPFEREWSELLFHVRNVVSSADLPPKPDPVFAKRHDNAVPLIGIMGSVGTGKSSLINAILGRTIAAVDDREHSSHPVFIGYGNSAYFGLRMEDGVERTVDQSDFLTAVSFDAAGNRDERIANGIVRLPLESLKICEFVDLPGLGGRFGATLDPLTIQTAERCPMVIAAFLQLGEDALSLVSRLNRAGAALLCARTKSDLELWGDDPETLSDVQGQEVADLLERDIVSPLLLLTVLTEWSGDFGVVDAAQLGERLQVVARYYEAAKACARIRSDGWQLREEQSPMHRQDPLEATLVAADRDVLKAFVATFPTRAAYEGKRIVAMLRDHVGGSKWFRLSKSYGPAVFPTRCTVAEVAEAIDAWLSPARWLRQHNQWVDDTLRRLEQIYIPMSRDIHLQASALLASEFGDAEQAQWFLERTRPRPTAKGVAGAATSRRTQ